MKILHCSWCALFKPRVKASWSSGRQSALGPLGLVIEPSLRSEGRRLVLQTGYLHVMLFFVKLRCNISNLIWAIEDIAAALRQGFCNDLEQLIVKFLYCNMARSASNQTSVYEPLTGCRVTARPFIRSHKTSENQSRAQNHNAKEIQAERQDEELRQLINAKRQRVNFPAATAEKQWEDLDSKIVLKLDSLIGDNTLEHNLATFGDIVYQTILETFRAKQYQSKGPPRRSRRQCEMDTLLSREDLEAHLKKTYSDTNRELRLEETAGLIWPDALDIKFNNKPPNLKEIEAVVYKARAKSAPGPDGLPYLLYKRCPNVLKWLHKIVRSAWNNIKVSKEWMTAEGVYIPKEQNSKEINQFHPISLLNVEGKMIFSVMATLLTKYLMANGYINTSVQKGGIPGVSGCLEYATLIWEAIQSKRS
ncbi:polyprotein [Elysia marginata]|uniref:Polyprotein n=1 Tax=Elysia marginata TaxID=1093978 RepID=A0AAV4HDD7_9GAST|nr:polyprotein [Elysia marginata]